MHHDEVDFPRHGGERVHHPAPVGAVAAFERLRVPADLAQDVRHGAGALAAAPAVDQWAPVLIVFAEETLDMPCHVFRDKGAAELLRLERRNLLIQSAHFGALGVVQHRRRDRAGNVVERVFRGRARVDDRVEVLELHAALL